MSGIGLALGDVVRCSAINRQYLGEDDKVELTASFKADRGKRFLFLMIGIENNSEPFSQLDVKQALHKMGLRLCEEQERAA